MRNTLVLVFVSLAAAQAFQATPPSHGFHPPMPGQSFSLRWQSPSVNGNALHEIPLALPSAAMPAQPDQVIQLPDPLNDLAVVEYLPSADFEQQIIPLDDPTGQSAVKLLIEGPKQSYERWLVAGDPERNRLTSLIGVWRYMAVADQAGRDELFRQFKSEFEREPKLILEPLAGSAVRGRWELPARAGASERVGPLATEVKVLRFYPHFAFDESTGEPRNLSDERVNPAALVELAHEGKREERWVFSKFPTFASQDENAVPVTTTLSCPLDRERPTPDIVLVTVNRSRTEMWLRFNGEITVLPMDAATRVDIPASRYQFQILSFVPSGRLVEAYRPAQGRGSVAALRLKIQGAAEPSEEFWLAMGKERVVALKHGVVTLSFGPSGAATAMGGHP